MLATGDANRLLDIFRAVADVEARRFAVVQRRSQHLVAVAREEIALFADVLGDAEDLLNEHQSAAPFTRRVYMINADLRVITHPHCNHFPTSHLVPHAEPAEA